MSTSPGIALDRHGIDRLFAWLEDRRRIATRCDRCARTFFSAICIAAAVIFGLWAMSPEPGLYLLLLFEFGLDPAVIIL